MKTNKRTRSSATHLLGKNTSPHAIRVLELVDLIGLCTLTLDTKRVRLYLWEETFDCPRLEQRIRMWFAFDPISMAFDARILAPDRHTGSLLEQMLDLGEPEPPTSILIDPDSDRITFTHSGTTEPHLGLEEIRRWIWRKFRRTKFKAPVLTTLVMPAKMMRHFRSKGSERKIIGQRNKAMLKRGGLPSRYQTGFRLKVNRCLQEAFDHIGAQEIEMLPLLISEWRAAQKKELGIALAHSVVYQWIKNQGSGKKGRVQRGRN